jgi:hypothetical protein
VDAQKRILAGHGPAGPPLSRPLYKSNAEPQCGGAKKEGPVDLAFYQKWVSTLLHPQNTTRSLLVVSSVGTGKTCMVVAVMANFALPPPSALPGGPARPKRIVFASYRMDLWAELYVSIGKECPGVAASPYLRDVKARRIDPAVAGIADKREKLYETGKLWCEAMGVEFIRYSTLGNLVDRAQRQGVGHRESQSSKCLQDYADALFILDEVHTIVDPQESTTIHHARNIRKIASLTGLIPVYGLCGFTATPIPTGPGDLFELHRLFASAIPALRGDAERLPTGAEFEAQYLVKRPIDRLPKPVPTQTVREMLQRCGGVSSQKDAGADSPYLYETRLRPEAKPLLRRVHEQMRHYVVFYDNGDDTLLVPRRRDTYVFSDASFAATSEPDDDGDPLGLTKEEMRELHIKWSVKTLVLSGQEAGVLKLVEGGSADPAQLARKLRAKFLPTSLVTLIRKTEYPSIFTKAVLQDTGKFFRKLYATSPVLYECFKRLCGRSGKALVYANVSDGYGVGLLHRLLCDYVRHHPTDNLLLRVPPGERADLDGYLGRKIVLARSDDPKACGKSVATVAADLEFADPLATPILLLHRGLGVGCDVSAGIREMHLLNFTLAAGIRKQNKGRPFRRGAYCNLPYPGHWRLEYFEYYSVGLLPWLVSSCDALFYYLKEVSKVDDLIDYFTLLVRRASLACEAFRDVGCPDGFPEASPALLAPASASPPGPGRSR